MSDAQQTPAQDTPAAGNAPADSTPAGQGTAAPDTQTANDKPADTNADFEFQVPEGVELNQEDLGQFKTIAKELNLPKDKAQAALDIVVKREQARADAFRKQVDDWGAEVKKDPELGKAENLAAMRGVIDKFGGDDMKSLLDTTGMGNHPTFVRFMHKVTQAFGEDKVLMGRGSEAAPPADPAKRMFPGMN